MHMELRLAAWVVFPMYVKLLINYVCLVNLTKYIFCINVDVTTGYIFI